MKKNTFLLFTFLLSTFWAFAQPANDDCPGAVSNMTTLTVGSPGVCSNTIVTLDNATNSGYVDAGCSNGGSVDLWYVLTMPASGAVRVDTSIDSSDKDTQMSAYKGPDCGNLTLIGCNDDLADGVNFFSRLEIIEPQGTTIYIRVWDINGETSGTFNICATEIVFATNDECDSPTPIPTDSNFIVGSNSATDSTNNTNFGSCNSSYEGSDIWFTVQTPSTGRFSVETSTDDGSITDTTIAIYSGTCAGGLTLVTCNDDIDAPSNRFSLIELSDQAPGEIFYVRVWSAYDEEKGTFTIRANELPTLGIEEDIFEYTFKMFPNPAKDIVNLKFNQLSNNNIEVSIYNVQGKLVKQVNPKLNRQEAQLNISNLQTGMYFLKVFDGINEVTKKLLVK